MRLLLPQIDVMTHVNVRPALAKPPADLPDTLLFEVPAGHMYSGCFAVGQADVVQIGVFGQNHLNTLREMIPAIASPEDRCREYIVFHQDADVLQCRSQLFRFAGRRGDLHTSMDDGFRFDHQTVPADRSTTYSVIGLP